MATSTLLRKRTGSAAAMSSSFVSLLRWQAMYKEIIEGVPFFEGLDDRAVSSICMTLTPHKAATGEEIMKEGDMGREMFILLTVRLGALPFSCGFKQLIFVRVIMNKRRRGVAGAGSLRCEHEPQIHRDAQVRAIVIGFTQQPRRPSLPPG